MELKPQSQPRSFELRISDFGLRISLRPGRSDQLGPYRSELAPDFLEGGILAEIAKVRVLQQPLEVVEALGDRLGESANGLVDLSGNRIAAGQVVEHGGVIRLDARQMLAGLEALVKFAAPGVVLAEHLPRVGTPRIALDDAFHEPDLDVEVALFFARQLSFAV